MKRACGQSRAEHPGKRDRALDLDSSIALDHEEREAHGRQMGAVAEAIEPRVVTRARRQPCRHGFHRETAGGLLRIGFAPAHPAMKCDPAFSRAARSPSPGANRCARRASPQLSGPGRCGSAPERPRPSLLPGPPARSGRRSSDRKRPPDPNVEPVTLAICAASSRVNKEQTSSVRPAAGPAGLPAPENLEATRSAGGRAL